MGYRAPYITLPYTMIFYVSVVVSFFIWLLSPFVKLKTTFIPSRVALAGTHHYYNCSRAKKELGYKPLLTVDQGIKDSLDYYKKIKKVGNYKKTK